MGNVGEDSPKLADALSEAESILEAAEKRAADLVSGAEKAHQEAQEKGYREGFQAGQTAAVDVAVRLIEESTAIGESLSEQAARLAIAICSAVIGEHVQTNPETVQKIATQALRESVVGDNVSLLVHPEDQKLLSSSLEELRRLAGGASVSIDSDPTIERGGCIVRTDFGEVDASISSLIEAVAAKLGIS